jgi:hypothetical protein
MGSNFVEHHIPRKIYLGGQKLKNRHTPTNSAQKHGVGTFGMTQWVSNRTFDMIHFDMINLKSDV